MTNNIINAQLRFFLDFINHKFAWILPGYTAVFNLIEKLFPPPIYTSTLYPPQHPTLHRIKPDLSFNLNPNLMPPQSTIIIDHFAGNPANLDQVLSTKPYLIEDISFSLGSKWLSKNTGSFGLITLFQIGKNLDLFTQNPILQPINFPTTLTQKNNSPIILTTKRFQLAHQINLYLKHNPYPPPTNPTLTLLQKIGRFIQNYPQQNNLNQLTIRRLYRQHKNLNLPLIYPQSQPFFTFLPYKPKNP